jgi:putative oxidoreductase
MMGRASFERRMPKMLLEGVDRPANFIRSHWGGILQRLFSTFPNHWPGAGLLLMRLSLGIAMICLGTSILLREPGAATSVAQQIIGVAAGVFVIAGLWTPVTATLGAIDQIWIALSFPSSQRGAESIHILLGVLCASVAMLGPGAWSIDARLFGRRRFPNYRSKEGDHPPKG